MPKVFPIQNSFAAGDVTPSIWHRDDLRGYKEGVKLLENMVCDPRGPARSRHGLRYIADIPGTAAKMFHFYVQEGETYSVVVTDQNVHVFNIFGNEVYKHGSAIVKDVNEVPEVSAEMPPGAHAMYLLHNNTPPMKLTWDGSTWVLAEVVFTGTPGHWVVGNYPNCLTFFQGRSWWGGCPLNPETFNASQSALFEDLTIGTEADEGLQFTLARKGRIRWMEGVKNLLIGSDSGEHIVTSDAGVITPGDIRVEQQSAYGAAYIQAVPLGNLVLYVSPDKGRVRDMGYSFEDDGWVSRDITFLAQHLTWRGIKEMHWDQDPHNWVWCVMLDGTLVGLTYERNNDVLGWHRHSFGEHLLMATAAVLDEGGVSTLWAVMNDRGSLKLVRSDQAQYMDLFVEDVDASSGTITVPHLANREVCVLLDGAVHPKITLDGAGNGTLERSGTTAAVGVTFTQRLHTLPMVDRLGGGSTKTWRKRLNKLYVRIFQSHRPLINGKRPPTRFPQSPMDAIDPPRTEDVRVVNLGWDQGAEITVEQDLPLLLIVYGLYGEMGQETT